MAAPAWRPRKLGARRPRPISVSSDEEQDERIRRLEQELADLDDDPPKD